MSVTDLRIQVIDWADPDFLGALRVALGQAHHEQVHTDGATTAHEVEVALRAMGYPQATVEYRGTAGDVLSGITRWIVRRGPADQVSARSRSAGSGRRRAHHPLAFARPHVPHIT